MTVAPTTQITPSSQIPTVPAVQFETQLETAMCLWEAFLEFHNNEAKPTSLTQVRIKVGTGQMRHVLMRLIQPCDDLWEALSREDKGVETYCSPFDWRFVPIFLTLCTVDPDSMETFNPVIRPPELSNLLDRLKNAPF